MWIKSMLFVVMHAVERVLTLTCLWRARRAIGMEYYFGVVALVLVRCDAVNQGGLEYDIAPIEAPCIALGIV